MKLTKTKLKQIIKEEISKESSKEVTPENTLSEGVENITPENIELVMAALKKLVTSPYTGPMFAAAFAAVGVQGIRDMFSRTQGPDDRG